ncbi:MAG: hypothetical protein ACRDK2_07960 [Solirubrobacteraceae bacterium]
MASAASQSRGHDRQEGGLAGCLVLEVVWQVGVERDAVALAQLVALAVADEHDRPALDECGLAAAGLVDRRIVRGSGGAAGGKGVAGELSALAGL